MNNSYKSITVLVICYKQQEVIKRALDSILCQKEFGLKKIVVCDEAWIFLKYKESGDFLANVARRGRKFNVSLLIGSQFMDEFLNCDERKSNNKYMCNSFLV